MFFDSDFILRRNSPNIWNRDYVTTTFHDAAEERQLVELLQTVINKLTAAVLKLRLRTTGMSVLFETSLGDIVIDLEVDSCPKTCENFLKLCKVYYYNLNAFFNGKFQTLNVSYFRLN